MSAAAAVEAALAAARDARASGDLDAARAVLDEAAQLTEPLGPDHALAHTLAWRRSKVAHDQHDARAALDAVTPLLEHGPFEHYPAGLDACARLATQFWAVAGYGSPALRTLLTRAHEAHRTAGDLYRAYQTTVWRSWDLACAGDLEELTRVLEAFSILHPDQLAGGPSRHSRAADSATSVPWLQQDLARTTLRAATWARRSELADAAEDVLETSADDAGFEREQEYWFLEPIALARIRLGRPDPDDYGSAWLALAPRLSHARAGYHRSLARASAEPEDAVSALQHAAREAAHEGYGPEWEIDPLVEVGRLTGNEPTGVQTRIDSHGVHVFRAAR